MAEAALSIVVQSLGELVIDELYFGSKIRREAEHLQQMLLQLGWFLKAVDATQREDENLQKFVSELRNVAGEAIDVLESYKAKIESQRKGGFEKLLSSFIGRRKIRSQILNFTNRIFDRIEIVQQFNLESQAVSSGSLIKEERSTFCHDNDLEDFVGLEEEVEILTSHLIKEDGQGRGYGVVSIYGVSGSGKTILARKVCNQVKCHFERQAWLCASQQEGQPKEVVRMILVELMPEEIEKIEAWRSIEELYVKLRQILITRRFLVVLDGIWSTDTWESIKDAFPYGQMCSRILLTTPYKKVALHIEPNGFHYQTRPLDENESWKLLKKKAFRAGDYEDRVENGKIEEIGRKMAENCRGLPLAVVVLGKILAGNYSLTEWESAYEDIVGHLQRELQKKLGSIYSQLPYRLKPCFLFLAQYSEDTYIDVLTLYQLWITEGMILTLDRSGDESLMEIAESYLNELVDMSMVQVQGDDFSLSRKFDSCRLHGMIRNFCLEEGRKGTSVGVMDFRGSSCETLPTNSAGSRLLIYTNTGLDGSRSDMVADVANEKLESLEFHNTSKAKQLLPRITLSENLLRKLKYLKSLVFESYKFGDHNNLEDVFKRLVHLRFLSFKNCDLDKLPSSVYSLPSLQTLDLRVQWGYPFQLPKEQWKASMLRHLFFSDSSVEVVKGKFRLKGLSRLEGIVNFQTDKMEVRDLFELKQLNEFIATVRDNNSLSLIVDHLKDVKMELRVRYCDFKKASDLLREVLECPKLFSLEILGPLGVELPMVSAVSGLKELVLVHSQINEDPMQKLKMIRSLQRLVLGNHACLEKQMRCSNSSFPSLKSLCFTELSNLENWEVEKGAMPKLLRLVIKRCTKLKVPDGLKFITTLKQVNTRSMPADFNKNIQELRLYLEECVFNLSEE